MEPENMCREAPISLSSLLDVSKETYIAAYFPKDSFYPHQQEAMSRIYEGISDKKLVLFEGACGTGKTLSALVPSLYLAKQNGKMVVIATNLHNQMTQFIEEVSREKPTSTTSCRSRKEKRQKL